MRKSKLPVTCALAVALMPSCTERLYPAVDIFGYVYPPECRRDLSKVKTPKGVEPYVLDVSPQDLVTAAAGRVTGRIYGLTWGQSLILIDNTLQGWVRDETLHHERCHVLMGEWHSRAPGARR